MVIPDLPGFGRSDKPANYDYSLARQSPLLERVVPRTRRPKITFSKQFSLPSRRQTHRLTYRECSTVG